MQGLGLHEPYNLVWSTDIKLGHYKYHEHH